MNPTGLPVGESASDMDETASEFDLAVFAEYEKEKEIGTLKTYSHEEAWKMLELD